ncbi:Sir2 family NAD+-dependent deacetylase [Shigella flexneri]
MWEEHRVEDVATPGVCPRPGAGAGASITPAVASFSSGRLRRCGAPGAGKACRGALGDRFLLVTQNIDNLHERAGNTNVIHMHGELLKVRCSQSGQVLDWTGDVTPEDKCHCCQFPAPLRPHVVWFGEMPLGMDEIYMALSMADVFIAIGTSGHVYPAAGFVHEAKLHGAHTVELNLEPSQVGNEFAEKYYGPASQVVPEFVEKLLEGL